jgi:hypothetical protein
MPRTIDEIWSAYSQAWGDISSDKRAELLTTCVADDVNFSAPDATGGSKRDLVRVLEEFQKSYPGAYFETARLISHNDQLLASWTMRNSAHAELLTGSSYARFDDEGRMSHIAGFWQF